MSPGKLSESLSPVEANKVIAHALTRIADSITPMVAGGRDAQNGYVTSLTEGVMGVTAALTQVASAIAELADAVRHAKKG